MKISKRNSIRQILDRDKIYNLSFYARKIGKKIDRIVSKSEIKTCLSHMKKEGQVTFKIINSNHVVGFSLKAVA